MKLNKAMLLLLKTAILIYLFCLNSTISLALSPGTYKLNDLPVGTVVYDADTTIGSTKGVNFIKVNQSPCVFLTADDYLSFSINTYRFNPVGGPDDSLINFFSSALKNNILNSTVNRWEIREEDDSDGDGPWPYGRYSTITRKLYLPSVEEILGVNLYIYSSNNSGYAYYPNEYKSSYQFDYFKQFGNTVVGRSSRNLRVSDYNFDKTSQRQLFFRDTRSTEPHRFGYIGCFVEEEPCGCSGYYDYDDDWIIDHQEPIHSSSIGYLNKINFYSCPNSANFVSTTQCISYFCFQVNPNVDIYVKPDNTAILHTHSYILKNDATRHWQECVCGDIINRANHYDNNADNHCDFCNYIIDAAPPTITGVTVPSGWSKSKTVLFNASDVSGGIQYRVTDSSNREMLGWTSSQNWTTTANDTYKLYVKDKWDNTSAAYSFTVTGIDITAPTVTKITVPEGWALEKTIRFLAEDAGVGEIQYQVTNSIGDVLQEWTSSPSWSTTNNGEYKLKIEDKLENTSPEYSFAVTQTNPVPTSLNATATVDSITVTWLPISGVNGYDINVDGTIIDNGSSTTYTHSGLTDNTEHTYSVRAKVSPIIGLWSSNISMIATKNVVVMNCAENKEMDVAISLSNSQNIAGKTFTVNYNANEIDVIDICGATKALDTTIGKVSENITITEYTPGRIKFTVNQPLATGKTWSGVVNIIKFRSKINGQSTVNYSVK